METEMKKTYMDSDRLRWLERNNEEYEQQLNQLRSANEILLVKVEAKNIEFNTDRIENQLKDKNTRIKQLEARVRELETELTFSRENPPAKKAQSTNENSNGTTRQRKPTTADNSNSVK